MKSLKIDPKISSNRELSSLVGSANQVLERVLGHSSGLVSAEWTLSEGGARPLLLLEISDWSGHTVGKFSIDELMNARQIEGRMVRLWGDLLQDRSRKQVAAFSNDLLHSGGEEAPE